MTLTTLALFTAAALLAGLWPAARGRRWFILAVSVLAVYALQPASAVRGLDYWLPTASLALCALGWAVTRPASAALTREDGLAGLLAGGLALGVSALRYVGPSFYLTPTQPPALELAAVAVLAAAALGFGLTRAAGINKAMLWGLLVLILGLFIVLKTDILTQGVAALLRSLTGQAPNLARAADLRWLGFSYMAFRILATIRERQNGRLPAFSLGEYFTYVLFFPAFLSGPIDRPERFLKDAHAAPAPFADSLMEGGRRLALGLFKKFVLADTLALAALNETNALQVNGAGWMWLILYLYAFRIYFDFSGYTDLAIGLGRLMGFKLPENFNNPYLKPSLTLFWNSWHITLAQWIRSYVFNPFSRAMRSREKPMAAWLVILLGQIMVMGLIGLWHGITWNFLIWGLWHALGLFINSRWTEFWRERWDESSQPAWLQKGLTALSTFATFNYVALGWVWFALPEPGQSLRVLACLFGVNV